MNGNTNLSVGDALTLIEASQSINAATQDAAILTLRAKPEDENLELIVTDAPILARIYRRRLRRAPDFPGIAEFVRSLDELSAAKVLMTIIPGQHNQVVSLWFDIALTRIIGCIVGTDRRTDELC